MRILKLCYTVFHKKQSPRLPTNALIDFWRKICHPCHNANAPLTQTKALVPQYNFTNTDKSLSDGRKSFEASVKWNIRRIDTVFYQSITHYTLHLLHTDSIWQVTLSTMLYESITHYTSIFYTHGIWQVTLCTMLYHTLHPSKSVNQSTHKRMNKRIIQILASSLWNG